MHKVEPDNQNHPDLQSLLSRQLGPEYLSTRPGAGGTKLTYVEGWRIIALANEIFGYDGWSSETKTMEVDFVDQNPDGRFNVGVSAVVKVTLKDGTSREDVGYGKLENSRSKADALDKCKKEAVTDALKRTMRTFGNLMGNCLYDKAYLNNIKSMQAQKEKFLPSKLYRPEFISNRSTTVTSTESKPCPTTETKSCYNQSSSGEKEFPKPKSLTVAPTNLTTSKEMAAPVSKPIIYKTVQQVTKVEPKFDPSRLPQTKIREKRKFEEEEEEEKENNSPLAAESVQEEQEEAIPFPATLSDKYFDFDESELAELDNVESSEIFGVLSGQDCSGDESGLITNASVQIDDQSTTLSAPPRSVYAHAPKREKISDQSVSRPTLKSTTNSSVRFNTFHTTFDNPGPQKLPLKTGNNLLDKSARSNINKVIQAGQLPNIKSSVIRYPSNNTNGPVL